MEGSCQTDCALQQQDRRALDPSSRRWTKGVMMVEKVGNERAKAFVWSGPGRSVDIKTGANEAKNPSTPPTSEMKRARQRRLFVSFFAWLLGISVRH